jgi:hypothetical protein
MFLLRMERRGARWCECCGSALINWVPFCPICASGSRFSASGSAGWLALFVRQERSHRSGGSVRRPGSNAHSPHKNTASQHMPAQTHSKSTHRQGAGHRQCMAAGHSGANAELTLPAWWERRMAALLFHRRGGPPPACATHRAQRAGVRGAFDSPLSDAHACVLCSSVCALLPPFPLLVCCCFAGRPLSALLTFSWEALAARASGEGRGEGRVGMLVACDDAPSLAPSDGCGLARLGSVVLCSAPKGTVA